MDNSRSQKLTRGTSRWGRRKSVKQSTDSSQDTQHTPVVTDSQRRTDKGKERERDEERDQFTQPTWGAPVSIVPDPLGELPSWYHSDVEWSASAAVQFRRRYPLHNPVGPRWYKNHHLIPSSSTYGARAPSVFSPSFPPISVGRDRPDHTMSMPVPVRSHSEASAPTPNSSQLQLNDAPPAVRTRKVSQSGPEADFLDASDPSGFNFHHSSPYDIGIHKDRSNPVSPDGEPTSPYDSRSRKPSSVQSQTRHKTVAPSPLSQSTSAVHLHAESEGTMMPRKLSKRRTGMAGLFGGNTNGHANGTTSAPVTPLDIAPSSFLSPPIVTDRPGVGRKLSKRSSLRPSPSSTSVPTIASGRPPSEKAGKRASILGRIAKKFTIMRRTRSKGPGEDDGEYVVESRATSTLPATREPSPEKEARKSTDFSKRVRPPTVDISTATPGGLDALYTDLRDQKAVQEAADRRSSTSSSVLDAPFSIGRLTIANPDAPSSGGNSPVVDTMQLPAAHPPVASQEGQVSSPPAPSKGERLEHFPTAQPTSPPLHSPPMLTPVSQSAAPQMVPARQHSVKSMPHQAHPPVTIVQSTQMVYSAPSESLSSPALLASSWKVLDTPDDSPLSRASMLVNPPTPYSVPSPMPAAAAPARSPPRDIYVDTNRVAREPSPKKSRDRRRTPSPPKEVLSPREESPTKQKSSGSSRRQTETFRLVRSPSQGTVLTPGAIMANGEQWEVVESNGMRRSKTKDRSSKSKEGEDGGRRESTRRDKRRSEQDLNGHGSARSPVKQDMPTRDDPHDLHRRPTHDHRRSSYREGPPADGRHDYHDNHRHGSRDHGDSRGRAPQGGYDPHPSSGAGLERRVSSSTRPTSELPSAADMQTVKAKEAWDMDRLFRGRSFHQDHGDVRSIPSPEPSSYPSPTGYHGHGGVPHGSGHTSYMLQSPFQQHGGSSSAAAAFYAAPPPPILYQAPYASQQELAQSPDAFSPRDSFADSLAVIPSEASTSPPPRVNPLPPPPRQSSYQSAQLSPTRGSSRSPELDPQFWKTYAGLTAH